MGNRGLPPILTKFSGLKLGWWVLLAVCAYAVVATVLLLSRPMGAAPAVGVGTGGSEATQVPQQSGTPAARGVDGLWFPIPGARVPRSDSNLPGAPRAYRHGVSQGFDFYAEDAGVPIAVGTPVIASEAGQIIRADTAYTEMDPRAWEVLIADVAVDGADEGQLDQLRGRQIWLRLPDGTVLRYGHLDSVRDGIRTGTSVYRGQIIGFVGNSGTDVAVAGRRDQARLRFEVWKPDGSFFGEGLEANDARLAAASLFVGP